MVEKILLFGLRIALAAILARRYLDMLWVTRVTVLVSAATVVGLRMLAHSYWGSLAIVIVPWMASAWIIFRICGTL